MSYTQLFYLYRSCTEASGGLGNGGGDIGHRDQGLGGGGGGGAGHTRDQTLRNDVENSRR